MNKNLEVAREKFLGTVGRISYVFGLNKFVAQLYALLYLSRKPLSLDEIAQMLGVSKGNVSINIRELEKWGAVRKIWVRGSRKDYYEADHQIQKVFTKKLKSAIEKRLAEVSEMIAEFNSIIKSTNGKLTEEEKEVAKGYLERIKKIEAFKNTIVNALALADKFL